MSVTPFEGRTGLDRFVFVSPEGKELLETEATTLGYCMYRAGLFMPAYTPATQRAELRKAYRKGYKVKRYRLEPI